MTQFCKKEQFSVLYHLLFSPALSPTYFKNYEQNNLAFWFYFCSLKLSQTPNSLSENPTSNNIFLSNLFVTILAPSDSAPFNQTVIHPFNAPQTPVLYSLPPVIHRYSFCPAPRLPIFSSRPTTPVFFYFLYYRYAKSCWLKSKCR